MALNKAVKTIHGFEAPNSYHKVDEIMIQNKNTLKFSVCSSLEKNTPVFNKQTHFCDYDLTGDNPIKQAYRHLKTLPEFADATDC